MVVRQRDVSDLDILVAPLVEELHGTDLRGDILGQDGGDGLALDFDFAFRHVGWLWRRCVVREYAVIRDRRRCRWLLVVQLKFWNCVCVRPRSVD